MSAVAETVQVEDFCIAKIAGKFVRVVSAESLQSLPEGKLEEGPYDLSSLSSMTKEALGKLYGEVAGTPPKNFKDKSIAIESIAYQVKTKMSIVEDPSSVTASKRPDSSVPGEKPAKESKSPEEKLKRKAGETFELLSPQDSEQALKSLAPQARELVLILTELGVERGSSKFTGAEVTKKFEEPEIPARLKTRQHPLRIFQYYKSKLISAGLLREA